MRKLYYLILSVALLASSCMKDMGNGGGGEPVKTGTISPDFDWKTVRDMTTTIGAPTVDGKTPDYAVVRIYSSPILTAENIVAKGVTKPSAAFSTSFTVPRGVKNIYVQTTLPDGLKSVEMVPVQASTIVSGAAFKAVSAPKIRLAAESLRESSIPDFPKMELKSESDFSGDAIIRSIVQGKNYQLGASWAYHAAAEYYIPAGVEIRSAIDLNGGFQPYPDPVLYVAGKLILSDLNIGQGRLAVLPGGEVTLNRLSGNGSGDASKPSIYLFEGGRILIDGDPNLGNRTIVNCGEFVVDGKMDLNNKATFFNAATAVFEAEEVKCSNSVKFYNDGKMHVEDLRLNSDGEFYNCENGNLEVEDECVFERGNTIYQRGVARIDEMTAWGTIYVNCHTVVKEIEAQGAEFNFASSAALDAEEVHFNNTTVSMAAGSVFSIEEYNADKKGGKNYFRAVSGADPKAVVKIAEKASTRKGHETYFSGPIEVVYDNSKDDDYTIHKDYLTEGAVLVKEQTVVIPECFCNGGKTPVDPDEEPEPAEEYNTVKGAPYTYCFEDRWPYLGDYDLNDVVVLASIDRDVSKDGSKVASLTFNWTLKAAGTTVGVAFGVQMDNVKAEQVASVVSSHDKFGAGFFASQGLEAGQENAVIPFFNKTTELLASSNTWPGHPAAAAAQHTTKVVFAEPVAAEKVLETSMNFFIAVESREAEVHMPTYLPTSLGKILKGDNHLLDEPYKAYVENGDRPQDNYMMWALMVPGDFRYPAENKDIRNVYKYFLDWASSNGTQHEEWYTEEVDESLIY